MAFEKQSSTGIDYQPCRYGTSQIVFRGPERSIDGTYIAVIGGTETYGRFIPDPYPNLLERHLGVPVVNLGLANAGPDVFAADPEITRLCNRARVTVVQVLGAHNLSNRLYDVHPRRNDRFLRAHAPLRGIFPTVDFTDYTFTRHMLAGLRAAAPHRFELVREELRRAWSARMDLLMDKLEGPVILLWTGTRGPDAPGDTDDPLYITRAMLDRQVARAASYVELCHPTDAPDPLVGMVFNELETPVAEALPTVPMHRAVTEALAPEITRLLA